MAGANLVLASRSPRRRDLMTLLGVSFDVTVADVAENPQEGESAVALVRRLSRAKATVAQATGQPGTAFVGCDTIVVLDKADCGFEILGKPADSREARTMLQRLRGKSHLVHSAVTILGPKNQHSTIVAKTRLRMRHYTDTELTAYVESGDPLDKAGSYAIQHEGFSPVEKIEGCYANVMGLPLCHLSYALLHHGIPLAIDVPDVCQAHTGQRCEVYQELRLDDCID